jgi:GT2 family glycosyltransferase
VFDGQVRLDEDFFFYGEDVAFGYRVHELGWKCHYDPVASITHLGGASSDPSRMPASNRSSHQWRARYLVQRKYNGPLAALGLRCVDVTVTTARLAQAAVAGPAQTQRATELGSQLGMILTTRIKQ